MTVYKYFFKIVNKNKNGILLYVLIFSLLSILNSPRKPRTDLGFQETKLNLAIVDLEDSPSSKNLLDYLSENNRLEPIDYDLELIREKIFLGKISGCLIIKEDFSQKLRSKEEALDLIIDSKSPDGLKLKNDIRKYLMFLDASYSQGDYDFQLVSKALKTDINVILENKESKESLHTLKWFNTYYNFVAYIIMAIFISIIGFVMSDFNNKNLARRNKISSITRLSYNFQLYLGQISLALLITTVFVVISLFLQRDQLTNVRISGFIINTYIYSFSVVCLTFLINNISNNKYIKNIVSIVLSLGTSFISGIMIPQEFLNSTVLKFARLLPTYYFVKANNIYADRGFLKASLLVIQLLFGAFFLVLGFYIYRIKSKAE